jgi:SdrD B-like domain
MSVLVIGGYLMHIMKRTWVTRLVILLVLLAMTLAITSVVGAEEETEGCIYGQVWYDDNQNGVRDGNEILENGARVVLLGVGPFRYQVDPYTLVDSVNASAEGDYAFCNVRNGTYEVRVYTHSRVPQSKLAVATGSNPVGPIPFERGGSAEVNFGLARPSGGGTTGATLNS